MTQIPNQDYLELVNRECERIAEEIRPDYLKEPIAPILVCGKRVRPLLTLLACEIAGGEVERALHAAVAIEILHTASLIHDDIMDGATLRRGKPTVNAAYGLNAAVLGGDYLVAVAYAELMRSPVADSSVLLRMFSDTYQTLCEGQALEEQAGKAPSVSDQDLVEIIKRKTASLVELSLAFGGLIGGASAGLQQNLIEFGHDLGIAFQIQDDILDLVGSPDATGKNQGLDATNQKSTSVDLASEGEDRVLKAVTKAEKYFSRADAALERLPFSHGKTKLELLVQELRKRDR